MMNTGTAFRFQKSKKIKSAILAVVIVMLVTAGVFFVWEKFFHGAMSRSDGNISTTWSTNRVSSGDAVELSIDITPDSDLDTVMALVEFNPSQLTYQSVSYEGSAFATQLPEMVADGRVRVQAAIMGGETTAEQSHIATVAFRAIEDHSPVATVSGGSARAGVALHPTVNGVPSLSDGDRQLSLWRLAYSAITALGLVATGWLIGWFIKRGRKGRAQK